MPVMRGGCKKVGYRLYDLPFDVDLVTYRSTFINMCDVACDELEDHGLSWFRQQLGWLRSFREVCVLCVRHMPRHAVICHVMRSYVTSCGHT